MSFIAVFFATGGADAVAGEVPATVTDADVETAAVTGAGVETGAVTGAGVETGAVTDGVDSAGLARCITRCAGRAWIG